MLQNVDTGDVIERFVTKWEGLKVADYIRLSVRINIDVYEAFANPMRTSGVEFSGNHERVATRAILIMLGFQ
jgi:hypothetical protein